MAGRDDDLVSVAPLLDRWAAASPIPISIGTQPSADALSASRAAETIGRPLGSEAFLNRLGAIAGRDPRPKRRARSPASGIE